MAAVAPSKREEVISEMQESLSRYSRSNDRKMVLRSLNDVKYLMNVPLEPISGGPDVAALEEEISSERVNLNGVPFRAVSKNEFTKTNMISDCLITLKQLCSKLCSIENVTVKPESLYKCLLQRMSRSTASADGYFKLNPLLGSSELMVMPTDQRDSAPIYVTLYVSSGVVHATVETTNTYGLFRKADVKPKDMHNGAIGGRPWIKVQGVVHERINCTSGDSVRSLKVKVPKDLY